MLSESVKSIWPFVPAKDFELATQFYKDLGFTCPDECDDVRTFKLGSHGFLLQDYYVEELANNFMMNLHVDDVDLWYKHITAGGLIESYAGTRVTPPKLEDWGMLVVHLIDPSGVLWHITQWPKDLA